MADVLSLREVRLVQHLLVLLEHPSFLLHQQGQGHLVAQEGQVLPLVLSHLWGREDQGHPEDEQMIIIIEVWLKQNVLQRSGLIQMDSQIVPLAPENLWLPVVLVVHEVQGIQGHQQYQDHPSRT